MTGDPDLLPVLGILFLSTLTRASLGFGDALVAMPLLSLVIDVKIATPLVALVSLLIAGVIVWRDHRQIHFQSAGWLLLASLAGIPVGLIYLKGVDERIVKGVLAVLILAFSLHGLRGGMSLTLTSDRAAPVFGFCAGVLGGAYNTPGPLVVAYGTMRRWPTDRFRATLQGYFLPATVLVVAGHYAAGLWGAPMWRYFLASLPVLAVSLLLGELLVRRIDRAKFIRLVYGFLVLVGAFLLFRSLAG